MMLCVGESNLVTYILTEYCSGIQGNHLKKAFLTTLRRSAVLILLILILPRLGSQSLLNTPPVNVGAIYSESMDAAIFLFIFGFDIGIDVLPVPGDTTGATEVYQHLGFAQDVSAGNLGMGLNLTLRIKLISTDNDIFKIYLPDWIPNYLGNGKSFLEVYLPKLNYVRYGKRGDPFFIKIGSIDDLTLGNGFIMKDYSNSCYMPEFRIVGTSLGIQAYPYFGFEAVIGDLATFDVTGARLSFWPLSGLTDLSIQKLEIGLQGVIDRKPYRYGGFGPFEYARVWGLDTNIPVVARDSFSLLAIGDIGFQEGNRTGGMVGVSGMAAGFLGYNTQIRFIEDGFLPSYFDSSYDLYRADRIIASALPSSGRIYFGWYVKNDYLLFDEAFLFAISAEGPFAAFPETPSLNQAEYIHLTVSLKTGPDRPGHFAMSTSYQKYYLGLTGAPWMEFNSIRNSVFQTTIEYTIGRFSVSLMGRIQFNAVQDGIDLKSTLKSSFRF